jgi:hypothetical protein
MTAMVENDSNPSVSELFPNQQSPSFYEQQLFAFRNQNIHETALASGSTVDDVAFDRWDRASHGMLQHHVEMLVVIMKDDAAWEHLQRSTRSCSSMRIRHQLDDVLKRSFQVAVERRETKRNRFLRSAVVVDSYGKEDLQLKIVKALPYSADETCSDGMDTLETESSSYDDDKYGDGTGWDNDPEDDIDEEDGEWLMGGRKGQGMLLEPISYKDVDLICHPRSQILGDSHSACGTASSGPHSNHELPAVFLSRRRSSSLSSSRLCYPSSPAVLAIAQPPNRTPLVERV